EKRNHPGSKLRQGFWMVFRFGVNNWGFNLRVVFTKAQLKSKSKLENECHSAQNTDLRLQIRLAPSLTDLR
ncbi:hypothetical protein RLL38_06465, partial [Streptococcus pneumoniae]|nr:hypothetical protein [Streptococcus pneumoniae]